MKYLPHHKVTGLVQHIARRYFAVALIATASYAVAHNVGQVQTTKFFSPATVNLLKARAQSGSAGFLVGDSIEYIVQFSPVANGANSTYGANGYITDYIPAGVEVVQASFVTLSGYDANGDAVYNNVAPNLPGLMPTGWGANPATYAASSGNFNLGSTYDSSGLCTAAGFATNICRSRLSEMYADTGIFYSTDARTAQSPALPNRILQGTAGNGYNTGPMTRGAALMALLGESVNTVHNLWDACMGRAFGGGTANALCVPNVAVQTAGGPTPFRAGSAVAGAQTGYPLDYTGQIGPWQRVYYAGSRIGDASLGPGRNMAQTQPVANNAVGWNATAPLTLSAGGVNTSLGYAVSSANPLPSGTNALRWAVGKLTTGQTSYVKITLRVTQPVGASGVTNGSEVFGGDSSNLTAKAAGTTASIDNPWAYAVPSVADNNSNLYVSKTACIYNAAATSCVPLPGNTVAAATTITYRVTYLNSGNANQTNVQLIDKLPCQVATSGSGLKIGAATGPISATFASLPYTTATTAGTTCGTGTETRNNVTFANMGTLGPGAGGSIIMNVVNTAAVAGAPTSNTAILKSTEVPLGVQSNAVTFVGSTTLNANPAMAIKKATTTPNVLAGGTAQYVITVQNTGLSALTTITVLDILPVGGTAPSAATRFNLNSTVSIQSSGLTTATALITSTTTATAYLPASALTPYNTQANASSVVVASWFFGSSTLAAGGIITITFIVDVGSQMPASATPYLNSARAIAGTPAAPTYTIDAANVAGITVGASLSLSKTLACYYSGLSCVSPSASGNIPNGAKVRYSVTYANALASPIANVMVTDSLPCQISATTGLITMTAVVGPIPGAFATTAATTGNCPATFQVITLGTTASLPGNATGSFTYEVQLTTPVRTSTVVTNVATLAVGGVATATTQVQNGVVNVANLQITKTANPSSVQPGGTLLYTITVTNIGTAPASTLTVFDWLPTGTSTVANPALRFSYTSTATISGVTNTAVITSAIPPTQAPYSTGIYAANQQQLRFVFAPVVTIPIGGTLTITVPAAVGASLPALAAPNYYNNNAAVSYNNSLSAASNAASANVTLVANLSVTKTNGGTTLTSGSATIYTLTFVNGGPSPANNSVIKDFASAGLNCTSVTCTTLLGGASCPTGMTINTPLPGGPAGFFTTGTTIPTFPASSSVALTVFCGVTATGQ
ncbi:MAG: hypothetical protein WBK51_14855 [Polaromonas sp.]